MLTNAKGRGLKIASQLVEPVIIPKLTRKVPFYPYIMLSVKLFYFGMPVRIFLPGSHTKDLNFHVSIWFVRKLQFQVRIPARAKQLLASETGSRPASGARSEMEDSLTSFTDALSRIFAYFICRELFDFVEPETRAASSFVVSCASVAVIQAQAFKSEESEFPRHWGSGAEVLVEFAHGPRSTVKKFLAAHFDAQLRVGCAMRVDLVK